MTFGNDDLLSRVAAKLEPFRIRSTVVFPGLFQPTLEMIEHSGLR